MDAGNREDGGEDRQDCHEPKDTFDRPGHVGGTARAGATPKVLDQAGGTATEDENGRRKTNDRPVREVEERVRRGEIVAETIDREQDPDSPKRTLR